MLIFGLMALVAVEFLVVFLIYRDPGWRESDKDLKWESAIVWPLSGVGVIFVAAMRGWDVGFTATFGALALLAIVVGSGFRPALVQMAPVEPLQSRGNILLRRIIAVGLMLAVVIPAVVMTVEWDDFK